jgi:formate dehydrogenase assembly factor FdhD
MSALDTWRVTLSSDSGRVSVDVVAASISVAVAIVIASEGAPDCAVVKAERIKAGTLRRDTFALLRRDERARSR